MLDPQGAVSSVYNGYKLRDHWVRSGGVQAVAVRRRFSLRHVEGKDREAGPTIKVRVSCSYGQLLPHLLASTDFGACRTLSVLGTSHS